MIKHKDHFHGSDLEKIEEIYGIKKEEIVSFSANVNPLGVAPLLRTTLADKIDAIYASMHFERCFLPDEYEGTPMEAEHVLDDRIKA